MRAEPPMEGAEATTEHILGSFSLGHGTQQLGEMWPNRFHRSPGVGNLRLLFPTERASNFLCLPIASLFQDQGTTQRRALLVSRPTRVPLKTPRNAGQDLHTSRNLTWSLPNENEDGL